MPDIHTEVNFESDFVAGLVGRGWLVGEATQYDRTRALYIDDVIGWLRDTQLKEYEKLAALHEGDTGRRICERLRKSINDQGTLHVLRNGFGATPSSFSMCAFRPENSFNAELLALYAKCGVGSSVRSGTVRTARRASTSFSS